MKRLAGLADRPRSFQLHVEPRRDDTFGLRLVEMPDGDDRPEFDARVDPGRVPLISDSVAWALSTSRVPRTALGPQRRRPIALDEAAGVRLALVVIGASPLAKRSRVAQLEGGVAAMSIEEAYYWYAKCVGAEASRARRALRLLLAEV